MNTPTLKIIFTQLKADLGCKSKDFDENANSVFYCKDSGRVLFSKIDYRKTNVEDIPIQPRLLRRLAVGKKDYLEDCSLKSWLGFMNRQILTIEREDDEVKSEFSKANEFSKSNRAKSWRRKWVM